MVPFGDQGERVPTVTPGAGDPVPFQDYMLHARGGQLVAHGESGLTGPDHHHIDVTDPAEIPHHSRVERPQGTRSRYNYAATPDGPEPARSSLDESLGTGPASPHHLRTRRRSGGRSGMR